METELAKLLDELGLRMRLLKATQEAISEGEDLSERDILILELLNSRGQMTVSEVIAAYPQVSESTISTDITKLWRNKLVSKTTNPDNQRITFVGMTQKGKETLDDIRKSRYQRLATLVLAMDFTPDEAQVMRRLTSRAISFFDEFLGLKKKEPILVESAAIRV